MTLAFFRALRDDHSASLVCLSNLCAGVVILPFIGGLGWLMDLPLAGQACMFYLGAVQIGAAYFFYSKGVRRVAVLRASTIALAEPVLNPAWVFLIMGERLSWHAIAGGAAILVGVALDLWLNREVDGASE